MGFWQSYLGDSAGEGGVSGSLMEDIAWDLSIIERGGLSCNLTEEFRVCGKKLDILTRVQGAWLSKTRMGPHSLGGEGGNL